ncbi:MAG: M28 family peptidase [Gemmatimonadaceae bacterium]
MRRTSVAAVALSTLAALTACRPGAPVTLSALHADSARLATDVRYLSSDVLEGRGTGSAGNDSARAYIARRFHALGLTPAIVNGECAPACAPGFEQPFVARSVAAVRAGLPSALPTGNVVAMIRGRDPALRDEVIVLGAHLDHLGRSSFGALDQERTNEIRNGADDNASGVAAILELARLLKSEPTRRSVVIVAFSGEELGLLGSAWFVEHAPFALTSIQAMLNFDMVGRLRDDKLMVYGTATATELAGIVADANTTPAFKLVAIGDGTGPSDHSSFYLKDMPVLHFFTDLHDDYHRATDDADKINAGGMARVVEYAERIVRTLGDRPDRLTFVRAPVQASAMGNSSRTGTQVYLGTVPDMGAVDVKGLRLSGVRPGSPADVAGLKSGDVIISLGGVAVSDLNTYSDALYSRAPGDAVDVVALRGGARITLTVTLGKRGG